MTTTNTTASTATSGRTVHIQTMGCARNDVDSEELAGRLEAEGFLLVDDASQAETVLVNTCGFVEQAKKDSVDALLEAADLKSGGVTKAVVAVGCLAERYGVSLAESLPEADAVLSFDDYAQMGDRLRAILAGNAPQAHVPRDRRLLLPMAPAERQEAAGQVAVPGHSTGSARSSLADADADARGAVDLADLPTGLAPASGPRSIRRRLATGPVAPLKLASGCDRRCTFCAIPAFRGVFLSRRPHEILDEARWLAESGVREIVLVSENSTSYGKDLGDLTLLESLLPELGSVTGIARVRVAYLQPAEVRPSLLKAIATTPGVAPYFDLSFQHSSESVLRRMRRYGSTDRFLELLDQIRGMAPEAGVRSNVIVGFPGETEHDLAELQRFLTEGRLDAVGVFGYSDEDGTEAAKFDGKLPAYEVAQRVESITELVQELMTQRAEDRVGEQVEVLVEQLDGDIAIGRAAHQGPEVDGEIELITQPGEQVEVGTIVTATVIEATGLADLRARAVSSRL